MVLPAPGEPTIRRLWPPAAATSSARRASSWPRTSERSAAVAGSEPVSDGPIADGRQVPRRNPTTPVDLRGLDGVGHRHDDPAEAATRRRDGDRDHTRGRKDLPLERDLAEEDVPSGGLWRHLPSRHQDAHGDGKVEPGAFFPEVAGGEVDHHAAQRPLELRMFDRRPDPIARILHGGAGESGHRERREAPPDERLDRDRMAADPEHGYADDPSVHVMTLRPSVGWNRDDRHAPVASPP
jgi:hypothetical protein